MRSAFIYFGLVLSLALTLPISPCCAQTAFTTEGQNFIVVDGSREFGELTIDPSNNAVKFVVINPDIGADLWVLGYRNTDRLIYGFDPFTSILHTIDADGVLRNIAMLEVDPDYFYSAGDISPDGRFLKMVGSVDEVDQILVTVDLEDAGYAVSQIPIPGDTYLTDLTYSPEGDVMYGLDANNNHIVTVNPTTAGVVARGQVPAENTIFGMYFDAYNTLYGFGTSTFGVAGAIFSVDQDFSQQREATGPVYLIQDMATAANTIDIQTGVTPRDAFPCSDVTFELTFGNTTGSSQSGIRIEHQMPAGVTFNDIESNPLGGNVNLTPGKLDISNLTLPSGTHRMTISATVGDVDGGQYESQSVMQNLPVHLGSSRISDNPATIRQDDPAVIRVESIEEDSIHIGLFACIGEVIELDGSAYGNAWNWSNGSTSPQLVVGASGVYILDANSGCQSVIVTYEVSVASCPFTIELMHDIIPRQTFPCSEVIYRFIIENDAGETHDGIDFIDTLPEGMTFLGLLTDTWGGELQSSSSDRIIHITGMHIDLGFDTLDVAVAVGNIEPGSYPNQAVISNFPQALGPRRFSDDPATQEEDSTALEVLGVPTDTLVVPMIICVGAPLQLNGTEFGTEHRWFNGSTDTLVEVNAPGLYELVVFDGCDPTYIFFDVVAGELMDVFFDEEVLLLSLGDSILLEPKYVNGGDTLVVRWYDPLGNSLGCDTCETVWATPTTTAEYHVWMSNDVCADSAELKVQVDNTRRIYFPNAFSPNGDGVNDHYYIHSPDYGVIDVFRVMDRWGQVLFSSRAFRLNDPAESWDGKYQGEYLPPGVYTVFVTVTFLDGITESFARQVAIIR